MRGPLTMPSSMARLRPNTGPPTSRTVVKPRIRVSVASAPASEIVVADVTERLCRSHPHQHRVPMRVDQARHQRASAAVDDACVGPTVDRDRLRRDALDHVAADQHIGGRRERRALAIEDAHVLEQRDSAARRRGSRGLGPNVAVRFQCRGADERRCARQDGAAADA